MKPFWLLVATLLLLVAGCGYRPTGSYTQALLGEKVAVEFAIPLGEGEASTAIIDAINEAVATRLGKRLAPADEADSLLKITQADFAITDLQKDERFYRPLPYHGHPDCQSDQRE